MDGELESFFQYDVIKLPDTGQQVEDYELFKKENYSELRKCKYGSWERQFEILQEQGFEGWRGYCEGIKLELPKPITK